MGACSMTRKKIDSPYGGRANDEWIASSPDARIPDYVAARVLRRQNGLCAILAVPLKGRKKQLDHKTPLSAGGQHRESNMQWILSDIHTIKSAHETKERAKADRVAKKDAGITKAKAKIPQPHKKVKERRDQLPMPGRRNIHTGQRIEP